MIIRKYLWLFLMVHLLPQLALAKDTFREFSNPAGQTITARPIGIFGDKVRIEFQDGREMNVGLDLFVEEDAKYLHDWAIEYLSSNDRLLEVSVSRKEDKVKDYKKDVPLTGGGVAEDALEIEEYKGYYEITLENRSQFILDPIIVEYRIFCEEEKRAATDRDDMKYKRQSGTLKYVIQPKEKLQKTTDKVDMVETKLGKGIVWSSGGDLKSKAKMIGVWFRVYNGETIIHEYALPTSIMKREAW